MVRVLRNYFYDRAVNSRRNHPLYIVPTVDGLKVIALNLILLIIGLIYANNYVLLFNFILFCLFLGSMFYTHFNLSGLKLEGFFINSLHENEEGVAILTLSSKNSQGHYFIRPYFKGHSIHLSSPKETFSIKTEEQAQIKIPIKGVKRGKEIIRAVYLETLFPLNFFCCFTFFNIDQEVYVYPRRENLKIHDEKEVMEEEKDRGEEFHLRDYQPGDSLKRVDWKKLAQTNKWYTRQFTENTPHPVMLILKDTPTEETLRSICYRLYELHQKNTKYGLQLGDNIFLSPGHSPKHFTQCLRELAHYDA